MSTVMDRKFALPAEAEWLSVSVPKVDAELYDGSHVYFPEHTILVAPRYPVYEDGGLVAGVTQEQAAQFFRDYNQANNTEFGGPVLFEDEAIRGLGKEHSIFNENFNRNGMPWRYGYFLDFNRPYGNGAEGIGQQLVTRVIGYRLHGGDVELGVTTIAPSGMVPALSKAELEKMIKAEGLKRLEKLRGKEIYGQGDEMVDVRNALGYPQFTLGHDARDKQGTLLPHSHHVYTPGQSEPERVGFRGADWLHGARRCFAAVLGADAGSSYSGGSLPLVRGGIFGAKVTAVREYKAEFPVAETQLSV